LAAFGCWAAPAAPQQPTVPPDLATAQDCLEIALQAGDDPTLTRAERIAALDKALLESLSRTDLCGAVGVGNEAGNGAGVIGGGAPGGVAGAGADGDSANAGADGDSANAGAPLESLPASGIEGDLPDSEAAETAAVNPARESPDKTDAENMGQTKAGGGAPGNVPGVDAPADNSKVPDDIPPAANDDIIAQQLRQAATDEPDPATRAKLWNEYRRYNNLPVKDIPESAGQPDSGANANAGAN